MQTTMLFFHYPDKIEVTYPGDESVYDSNRTSILLSHILKFDEITKIQHGPTSDKGQIISIIRNFL